MSKNTLETVDHAERAHAEFGPSSLKYVSKCAGYNGRSGTNPAAEMGTRIHEALEIHNPSALHSEQELELYEWIVKEETQLLEMFLGHTTYEYLPEIRLHITLDGTETFGTGDVIALGADGTAFLCDYKTGISQIDEPRDNWQARAYTLGTFQKYPQIERIVFAFIVPQRKQVLIGEFFRSEEDWLRSEISRVILAGERVRPQWESGTPDIDDLTPSVNCRFCKYEDNCPALGGMALAVAAKVSKDPVAGIDFTATDPATLEELYGIAKVLENWAASVKSRALAAAKDGVQFPNLKLKSMGSSKTCSDNARLFEIATENFGLTAEEVLEIANIPLKKLADKVGTYAEKGQKGKFSEEFLDAVSEAGIVSTSETRYTLS